VLVTLEPISKGTAQLLTTNTEVSISPKLHPSDSRTTTTSMTEGKSRDKSGAELKDRIAENSTEKHTRTCVLRAVPVHTFARAFSKRLDPQVAVSLLSPYSGPGRIAYVSPRTFTRITLIPVPLNAKHDEFKFHECTIRRMQPPIDPTEPSEAPPAGSQPVPTDRVLRPGAMDDDSDPTTDLATSSEFVYVRWLEGILGGYVLFPSRPDGVDDWDLVQ
jgi:peroxin-1